MSKYEGYSRVDIETQMKYTKQNIETLERYLITGHPVLGVENVRTGKHKLYDARERITARRTIDRLKKNMLELTNMYLEMK